MPHGVTRTAKILALGAFAVGKTTLVGAVSQIRPLRTEEVMTSAGIGIDDTPAPGKTTTTVAMDFGRLTLATGNGGVALYVFGAPGQPRFWRLWQGLAEGAIGLLLLVDVRRLDTTFEVLDQIESDPVCRDLPLVVAVNQFDDAPVYPLDQIRRALALDAPIPLLSCDARDPASSIAALCALVDHALARHPDHPRPPDHSHPPNRPDRLDQPLEGSR